MVEIMGSLFRSEKGEEITMFGSRSSTNVNTSNVGANTVLLFSCGEKGHVSYACPKRRMDLIEVADEEEDLPEVKYNENEYEEEDVDLLPMQGESS